MFEWTVCRSFVLAEQEIVLIWGADMTMHGAFSKENEGNNVQNPIVISPTSVPWWGGLAVQSAPSVETLGQLMALAVEQPASGDQAICNKQAERPVEQHLPKGNTAQFTIVPGNFCLYFSIFSCSSNWTYSSLLWKFFRRIFFKELCLKVEPLGHELSTKLWLCFINLEINPSSSIHKD